MEKRIYVIDGKDFATLQGFYGEVGRVLIPGISWGENLDAFNEICGGFGTPEEGFILRWENSALSRQNLGYPETIKWLEEHIQTCHSQNVRHLQRRLAEAHRGRGETLFDTLMKIIETHGIRGTESEDDVELQLL